MTTPELREMLNLWILHLETVRATLVDDPPLFHSTEERRAEVQIRNARWLLEQAAPALADLPMTGAALEDVRQLLGRVGGEYRDGEAVAFDVAERARVEV